MQLQVINEDVANGDDNLPWISGWFKQRDGHLLIQYFKVLPVGTPAYAVAGKMVDFWGQQLLGIEQACSNEMSGSFGLAFLIPAVKKAYL